MSILNHQISSYSGCQLDCVVIDEVADKLNDKWHSQGSNVLNDVLRFCRITYKGGNNIEIFFVKFGISVKILA